MKWSSKKRTAGAVGLLGAGAVAGAIVAAVIPAGAATSTPSPGTGSSSTTSGAPASFPPHGTAAHEDAEKAVTGANATKAQAAAVTSVGGGTAGAVTTDMSGRGYEVTVTKADGSTTEVHLDSSFAPMGPGGPRDGGPGSGPAGAPDSSSTGA